MTDKAKTNAVKAKDNYAFKGKFKDASGRSRHVTKGEAFKANDPLVKAFPWAFEPVL